MPKIDKYTNDTSDAKEIRRTLVLNTAQNYGSICFSADVRQWNIVFSVVHVHCCFFHLFIYYCTVSYRTGQRLIEKAYLFFRFVCANGK